MFCVSYPPNGDQEIWPRTLSLNQHEKAEWHPVNKMLDAESDTLQLRLIYCRSQFENTGNPIWAFEAFRHTTAHKLYPPIWVLDFIYRRLDHAAQNDWQLDRAFGIVRTGKGRRLPPRQQISLEKKHEEWCLNASKLEAAGLTQYEAAQLMAPRYDVTGPAIVKAVNARKESLQICRDAVEKAAQKWTDAEKKKLIAHWGVEYLTPRARAKFAKLKIQK
ncbi:MAG: hypothetical protein AABY95_00565 [Pseudomonadota bacterium]